MGRAQRISKPSERPEPASQSWIVPIVIPLIIVPTMRATSSFISKKSCIGGNQIIPVVSNNNDRGNIFIAFCRSANHSEE